MILPNNIKPELSLYYTGALIIKILKKKNKYNLYELFIDININNNITFNLFMLTLDWLYLIETLDIKNGNEVNLCL